MKRLVLSIIIIVTIPLLWQTSSLAGVAHELAEEAIDELAEEGVAELVEEELPEAAPMSVVPDPERAEEITFGRVGDPYDCTFIASGGHGYGYIWDHGVLPMGLVMMIDTEEEGVVYIEGVPADAGSHRIKVVASDAADPSLKARFSYTLQIVPHLQ